MQATSSSYDNLLTVYQNIKSSISATPTMQSATTLAKKVNVLKKCLEQNFLELVQDTVNNWKSRSKKWGQIKITLGSVNKNKKFDAVLQSVEKVCIAARIKKKFQKKFGPESIEYKNFFGEFGCDVNGISKSGHTPLTLAVINNREDLISLLAELNSDFNKSNERGHSPLSLAVLFENPKLITLLIQLGAKVNASDGNGFTPLGHAVEINKVDLIQLLLSLKAQINKPDRNRYTALSRAIKKKNLDLISFLVKSGADLNLDAITLPLDDAVATGSKDVVKLLHDLGANINKRDKNKLTPIYSAISSNQPDMVAYLLSLGAKRNIYGRLGRTPLTLARWKNEELVKALKTGGVQIPNEEMISDMIFLAHVFGLQGHATLDNGEGGKFRIKLETMDEQFAVQKFLNLLNQFFSAYPFQFSKNVAKKIKNAFRMVIPISSIDYDAILNRVKADLPLVILGGTKTHAIYFVIYDNKLVVCNRGVGCGKNTCMFYKFNCKEITIPLIKKLKTEFLNMNQVKEMIDDLKLDFLFGIDLKNQKVDNCVWANLKAALAVMLFLLFGKGKWRSTYKRITQFMREVSLDAHMKAWGNTNVGFLNKIRTKLNGKKGFIKAKKLVAIRIS